MESRKTKNADLERKRTVFFQLGLIIAISAALAAFEWKTPDNGNIVLPPPTVFEPESGIISIPIKDKPEIPKPRVSTFFNEVDNTDEILPYDIVITESTPDDAFKLIKLPVYQPEDTGTESEDPFIIVEDMPVFPGGEKAMFQYLTNNIHYPLTAKGANIEGTVYIGFIVEADGSVSSVKVLRGLDGGCSEEAMRVVREMPFWTPGKQRGKPVRVSMNLPVHFKLL